MTRRPFDETCPIFRASRALGDACSLMLIRDLFLHGPSKFHDFQAQARGFSPNTVSARLKRLIDQGLVATRPYQAHPPRQVYELTPRGRALQPVLFAMFSWATEGGTLPQTYYQKHPEADI